ncbi:MAG: YifB family Mg chelatase-like AAA ATPase [Robiginitomaculum sp.]|nr:YifB family Mg chelatase-like AAA ATPase [Robiginitomaculum sp.]
MATRISTFAFDGVDAREVDVQVQIVSGLPSFSIVGLGDKAVAESRERVRAAFAGIGLALPGKRIVVNLAPADQPKEGSHYDLPIALALMMAIGVLPEDAFDRFAAVGELSLSGMIAPITGALPAAVAANALDLGLICPVANGPEAAWAGEMDILAPPSLIALVNHVKGRGILSPPVPGPLEPGPPVPELRDVRGQEMAKRALEIAAAGSHNLLMVGPPGSGKSMLAARLAGLLPPLSSQELLEVSMIHSLAGLLEKGKLTRTRPFRSPHHGASMAALVGGGHKAKPGEASLAHRGVLFLDEFPEFTPQVLDSLRQPLETGSISVARANAHITYPARFQLIGAMNPCRCGSGGNDGYACRRGPRCASDYQARISGPLLDRMDLQIDVPAVTAADLALPPSVEGTEAVAKRVAQAREIQFSRADEAGGLTNAEIPSGSLDHVAAPDEPGRQLLLKAAQSMQLTARGYHRVLRTARTIADLEGATAVRRMHIAESLGLRRRNGLASDTAHQPNRVTIS